MPTAKKTTWSLVSTMYGTPEMILPCIAHHLQSDADYLHIYLDGPLPEIEKALRNHQRCIVTVCDDAYWSKIKGNRPARIVARQNANVGHARHNSDSDWIVHIDSDEFLFQSGSTDKLNLSDLFADVPIGQDWVRFEPYERILVQNHTPGSIFDGMFRSKTLDQNLLDTAYGNGSRFLKHGLSGHSRGKLAFRRKTDLEVGLHEVRFPQDPEQKRRKVTPVDKLPPFSKFNDVLLLHFEGWTPLHWTKKLLRFVDEQKLNSGNAGRRAAIKYMAENADSSVRLHLFDMAQKLSEEGFSFLEKNNVGHRWKFDPSEISIKKFPNIDFDFSVEAFDARLRNSDPEFFQRHGI
jgi:hypothetical protein